MNKLQKNTL